MMDKLQVFQQINQYISIMNNGLIMMISMIFFCLVSSRLLIGKHLIVSNSVEIILRNKFRFTDILMSNATRKIITSPSHYKKIAELPDIPIHHQGRQQSKYHQISQTMGVYLIRVAVDVEQLQSYFDQNQENHEKYDFYLVPQEFRKGTIQVSGNTIVCFYGDDIQKMGMASLLSSCPLLQTQQSSEIQSKDVDNKNRESQIEHKEVLFMLVLSLLLSSIFIAIKLLIYFKMSKNDSRI